ncbi:ATP-binding cassette domain-containing protein [Vreelandella alkaliphila]|uniref:Nickel import system ATP-binding protein NikD n=1 Tax=Halomonas campaniensis TaxID=213554 RepID=A0A3D0KCY9_9GAMM|nr:MULTISPECIES: ATP-binding cassette domain-containing protein [unclassified Halomonas]HBS83041.1 ABC transporter ATP-binding protein [Halomonas campaniensis]HCA01407.1 ABC transporter ATP-binding protein [Halomonas campaniensis]
MLYIENLTLQLPYYKHWWRREWTTCVDNLSLSIHPGEVHAVIGASGAGKSLLAYTIMGLLPEAAKTSGQLFFKDTPLTAERQRQLRGRQLALIPQSLNALDPLASSQRQVSWAARRAGQSKTVAWRSAERTLNHYQLNHHAQRAYPHQLSGGMARRVLAAMAQIGNASLIIADEPSVGLDPQQRDRVLAALKALALEGKAIMLITHDLRHALPIADHVTILRQGKCIEATPAIAFQGNGEQLKSTYACALWNALPDNTFSTQVRANESATHADAIDLSKEPTIA